MGSGKSTVGKSLADRLDIPFKDLDEEIERKSGVSIASLFSENGEIYFRKLEHEVLTELLYSKDIFILSLGGGTPLYFDHMDMINSEGFSIYLQMTISVLAERLSLEKEKRPLLSHLKEEEIPEFVAKHLFERDAVYREAKLVYPAGNQSVEEIVKGIIPQLP